MRPIVHSVYSVLGVLVVSLFLSGCRFFSTEGDRKMVAVSRDQVRRADAKCAGGDAAAARGHLRVADAALEAVEERHGRARLELPEDDAEAEVTSQRAIGAYQSRTRFWQAVELSVWSWFMGAPVRNGLAALAPPLLAVALLWLQRYRKRLAETEEAALAAGQPLVDGQGGGTEALKKATAPLGEVYTRRRKSPRAA